MYSKISFVIPAYNEETNIRLGALDKVSRYLENQNYQWEVLVVNDGSSDATQTLADNFVKNNKGFRLLNEVHRGKAMAVISGLLEAKGEIIVFTDLDQATPLSEVEKLLPWFSKGFQVVIGSRSGQRKGAPLSRRVMARGFMLLRSLVLGLGNIKDTQCGFKAFDRKVIASVVKRLTLYRGIIEIAGSNVSAGFDVELLYLANQLGYRIKEVPVEWHYVETRRVSPIRDSVLGLVEIFKIRLNELKGLYR